MKKNLKSILVFGLVLAFLMPAAAGCNPRTSPQQETPIPQTSSQPGTPVSETAEPIDAEKVIIIGDTLPPGDINPLVGQNIISSQIVVNIYDTLIGRAKVEKDGMFIEDPTKIEPMLAKSWDVSDDGMTWVFHLRDDIKFHNGSAFDADDVLFSFDMIREHSSYAAYYNELITDIVKVDPYTVEMKLSRYDTIFPKKISASLAVIMDKETVIKEGGENIDDQMKWMSTHAVGTGAYQLTNYATDAVTLTANKDYFRGKPKIDKVIFKNIAEVSNLKIMLEKGDIDMYRGPNAVDYASLEANPDLDLMILPANSKVVYFGVNMSREPFNNLEFRKAISYAIPYEQILQVLYHGEKYMPRARSLLTEELLGFTPVFNYEYDIEKAKECFDRSGLEKGIHINFDLFNSGKFKDCAVMLQTELDKIGVKLDITPMTGPAFFKEGDGGKLGFFIVSWWDNAADPVNQLVNLVHSNSIPKQGNYAFMSIEEIDKLLDQAKSEMNDDKRAELLKQVQTLAAEQYAYFPVNEGKIIIAKNKKIVDYVHYSDSIVRFIDLDIVP